MPASEHTNHLTGIQTRSQVDIQTNILPGVPTRSQADTQTLLQADKRAHKQTNLQADTCFLNFLTCLQAMLNFYLPNLMGDFMNNFFQALFSAHFHLYKSLKVYVEAVSVSLFIL